MKIHTVSSQYGERYDRMFEKSNHSSSYMLSKRSKKSTTVNIFENNCPSSYLTTNNINKIDLLFNRVSESWWVKSFGVKHERINHNRSKNSRNKSSIDIFVIVYKNIWLNYVALIAKKYFSTKMGYHFHIRYFLFCLTFILMTFDFGIKFVNLNMLKFERYVLL